MKALSILSVVQTIVILFLLVKLIDIDNRIRSTAPAGQNTSVIEMAGMPAILTNSDGTNHYLTAEQLRDILGEELQIYLGTKTSADKENNLKDASNPIHNADNQYELELVAQKIEYFSSIGTISDLDMRELQMDIAKLNKEGQKRMLKQLTKAMNTGQIKGHF